MLMRLVDTKTDGAVPAEVTVEANDRYLTIHFHDTNLQLPIEEIRGIVREEDDLK